MRIILVGLAIGLGGCALVADREPAETHVCTQSPDGLAECRQIGPAS